MAETAAGTADLNRLRFRNRAVSFRARFEIGRIEPALSKKLECGFTIFGFDDAFNRALPQFEETNARLRELVKPLVSPGKVPVMGGFLGAHYGPRLSPGALRGVIVVVGLIGLYRLLTV